MKVYFTRTVKLFGEVELDGKWSKEDIEEYGYEHVHIAYVPAKGTVITGIEDEETIIE